MIIVGEKEENNQTLSVRKHGQGDLGTFSIQEFVSMVEKEIDEAMSQ
jgi:threonyl-tRNA synthetase